MRERERERGKVEGEGRLSGVSMVDYGSKRERKVSLRLETIGWCERGESLNDHQWNNECQCQM